MPSQADLQREKQYVEVLREVTSGDTLGAPQELPDAPSIRRFEMSGKVYATALIERMVKERLLATDAERGVIVGAAGERYFTRNR